MQLNVFERSWKTLKIYTLFYTLSSILKKCKTKKLSQLCLPPSSAVRAEILSLIKGFVYRRSLQPYCVQLPLPSSLLVPQVPSSRKGSKQSVLSFRFTSLRFIRSHTVCIYWRARRQQREEAKHALMQAQSGQSLHASASLRYAVTFRFVSCLFPHAGQSWMKGCIPFIRKNWNSCKRSSWRLYGSSFCRSRQMHLVLKIVRENESASSSCRN